QGGPPLPHDEAADGCRPDEDDLHRILVLAQEPKPAARLLRLSEGVRAVLLQARHAVRRAQSVGGIGTLLTQRLVAAARVPDRAAAPVGAVLARLSLARFYSHLRHGSSPTALGESLRHRCSASDVGRPKAALAVLERRGSPAPFTRSRPSRGSR